MKGQARQALSPSSFWQADVPRRSRNHENLVQNLAGARGFPTFPTLNNKKTCCASTIPERNLLRT